MCIQEALLVGLGGVHVMSQTISQEVKNEAGFASVIVERPCIGFFLRVNNRYYLNSLLIYLENTLSDTFGFMPYVEGMENIPEVIH